MAAVSSGRSSVGARRVWSFGTVCRCPCPAPWRRLLVRTVGCPAEDLAAAAAVGDASGLLGAGVDQFSRPGAFMAAHGFAGGAVLRGQGGQVVATRMRWAVEAAMPRRAADRTGPIRCSRRGRRT
ncbi:hypothetical protein Sdia_09450 [Streptomyces diastaticus subsp. diastaticus]|uniref:Uncharacterized protein n=1 Tax=Streptomyces diastaticus subsp. diastaticus TaxID=68040 RepID=A0ABQ1CIG0_STRDI|nr:hypothetical protein Sdia_09450 [Streptomyces diastaticus subsp. diastaticus]GGU15637.1 hypothetical protein GCM10015534_17910 [Streptomyces diastaticus subsp. diastaticus]